MRAGTASMMAVEGSGAEPAGNVQAHAVDGPRDAFAAHTGHGVHRQRRRELRFVEAGDIGDGAFQRRDLACAERGARFAKFRGTGAQLAQRRAAEGLRGAADGRVTFFPHGRDDVRRLAEDIVATAGRWAA
jgi:hypothetical protein